PECHFSPFSSSTRALRPSTSRRNRVGNSLSRGKAPQKAARTPGQFSRCPSRLGPGWNDSRRRDFTATDFQANTQRSQRIGARRAFVVNRHQESEIRGLDNRRGDKSNLHRRCHNETVFEKTVG